MGGLGGAEFGAPTCAKVAGIGDVNPDADADSPALSRLAAIRQIRRRMALGQRNRIDLILILRLSGRPWGPPVLSIRRAGETLMLPPRIDCIVVYFAALMMVVT